MRQSIALRQQLRDAINSEIADRTKQHQAKIAAIKATAHTATMSAAPGGIAAAGPAPATPLVMLAHGDSWFDYPLDGNGLSLTGDTDIIAQLQKMGNPNPAIQNVSHFGDATSEEMSVPKQERMIQSIQDPANWLNQGPDAILFSGGGDDIAGNQFCIFLDYAGGGLDAARFQGVLDMVEASYRDLFAFRDSYAPGVPIFGHCYDFPIPNGSHPVCAGPWLQPSLSFTGNAANGTALLHQALIRFHDLLFQLAGDPNNNFTLIQTQGILATADWANELHPYPSGFQKLANAFFNALQARFPGRI
ncbi:MAG: hypothetical protein ABSA94_03815 [Acidobacteriaceae bacterium]|jgi:hypothetical protein